MVVKNPNEIPAKREKEKKKKNGGLLTFGPQRRVCSSSAHLCFRDRRVFSLDGHDTAASVTHGTNALCAKLRAELLIAAVADRRFDFPGTSSTSHAGSNSAARRRDGGGHRRPARRHGGHELLLVWGVCQESAHALRASLQSQEQKHSPRRRRGV